ncbi:MAG: sigma-70 family RNA polymerase sigma factor [Kiritimatiellae bacterium]|nr:sigma-70 family RNA polymerase sigma factor [Kiritimatiellia bacterium]
MDIVEELRQNRESGARRLETEYKAGLMTLARRFCQDSGDAEELVNRTFAAVVEGIDDYLEQSAFFAWMCQILTNIHSMDVRRKSNQNIIYPGIVPDTPDEEANEEIYRNLDHSLLRDAIQSLPKEMKEVIVMHYLMEEPVPQVAKFLCQPVTTVKWRLHCARKALAAKMGVKMHEMAEKPGGKAVILALLLCGITALGAGIGLAVAHLLPSPSAAVEQQADNSNDAGQSDASNLSTFQPFNFSTSSNLPQSPSAATPSATDCYRSPATENSSLTTQGENMNKTTTTRAAAMLAAATFATSAAIPASTAAGNTLTWVGSSSGLLSVASNWTPSAVPQPGDTCVFHSATTLEAEDFDFGTSGLTLENDATLTVLTHFAGTGGITKRGNGVLAIKNTTAGSFTGDVTIEAGQLNLASGSAIQFGQGKIIFTQASSSNNFITQGDFYSQNLQNDVEFRGSSSTYAIYLCRNGRMSGSISSINDFSVGIAYLGYEIAGNINAPRCTVTIEFPQSWNSCECNLSGSINASLVKKHSKDTTLSGRSDYADNSLRVEGGNLIVASAGYWGGTNVLVSGSSSVLRLRGSQNLSTLASVQVENGGKLNLDSACAVTVSSLIVDGVAQRSGMYGASNLPNYITGAGSIIVSPKTWVGGASGYLSAASNWSDGVAPQPGDVLSFSNPVELLNETVNLGAEGYTLSSSHAISNHVWFTGSGGIVKRGSGSFYQFGDAGGDFAGGARFENCQLILLNRYQPGTSTTGHKFFGTGMVALDGNDARIRTGEWACGLTNAIDITNSFIPSWDSGWGSLTVDQGSVVIGPIVSSSNLKLHVRNIEMHLPSIDAPGHTVQIDTYWGSSSESYRSGPVLDGPVNANVTTAGNRTITFTGSSPNPDHSLTLTTCTNVLSSTAFWGGKNIVVTGASTILALNDSGNLSEEARISVASGGKIKIASGVKVQVAALFVDGAEMAAGVYGAGNLPTVISGEGKLRVGEAGTVMVFR